MVRESEFYFWLLHLAAERFWINYLISLNYSISSLKGRNNSAYYKNDAEIKRDKYL